jgi:hypothetical protein
VGSSGDSSLEALHAAVDAQRRVRGLRWSAAVREIGRASERAGRRLSRSTVKDVGTRTVAGGDGVRQMLRWLNRAPESFMPGDPQVDDAGALLPHVPPDRVLRFDTRKMYAALDARGAERNLTWSQVAKETRCSVQGLTRLSKGRRTVFPAVMRIVRWLGEPASRFTRV